MNAKPLKISAKLDTGFLNMSIRADDLDKGKLQATIVEKTGDTFSPTRYAYIDVVGNEGNRFMVVRSAIRAMDENGDFSTVAATKDGGFVDFKGAKVETEAEAAREYVYEKAGEDGKRVFGQIATINVQNKKTNLEPTEYTLLQVKMFSDKEALEAERLVFDLKALEKGTPEYTAKAAEINAQRKAAGEFKTFFINEGHELLTQLKFDVRLKKEPVNEPS